MIEETCFTTILTCKLDMYSSRGVYKKLTKKHQKTIWNVIGWGRRGVNNFQQIPVPWNLLKTKFRQNINNVLPGQRRNYSSYKKN